MNKEICKACGGVLHNGHTLVDDEKGNKIHYHCAYKKWAKKQDEIKTTGNRPVATPPKAVL
jgi:hypothetical protein